MKDGSIKVLMNGIAAAAILFATAGARADALTESAGKYQVQPSSQVNFAVAQVGGGGIKGAFGTFSGWFSLSAKGIGQSRVEFTLMPESVATKDRRIANFLRSSAVFDAANFPQVLFKSTKVTQLSETSARIDGALTARGITKPVSFEASLGKRDGRFISFHVTGNVRRSPFGMDVGTPIYSNDVQFDMVLDGKR
jgi:polyisoprenoid-binding protein YceI